MKKSKVRKVGNSLGLTLPQDFVKSLDLKEGDEVSLHIHGDQMIVERFDPQLLELMEAYKEELNKFKHTFKALE